MSDRGKDRGWDHKIQSPFPEYFPNKRSAQFLSSQLNPKCRINPQQAHGEHEGGEISRSNLVVPASQLPGRNRHPSSHKTPPCHSKQSPEHPLAGGSPFLLTGSSSDLLPTSCICLVWSFKYGFLEYSLGESHSEDL